MLTLSSVSAEMIYRVDPLGKYLLQIILLGFFYTFHFQMNFVFFEPKIEHKFRTRIGFEGMNNV